ncbi:MAG: archease [Ignavibacteriales bacterium]|nr:archease [Ignavibacteriales bacterium]
MDPHYRILEHPADLGIEAWGESIGGAFENAVLALVSALVDPITIEPGVEKSVLLQGPDYEGLLVKLLSEVIYLFDGEKFLTGRASLASVTPTSLEGRLFGEAFDEKKHRPRLDVKAVTYHQISIKKESDGFHVTVFVDI